jgi:hypothetical protein
MRLLSVSLAVILTLSAVGVRAMKLTGAPALSASALAPLIGVGAEPCSVWIKHRLAKDQAASVATQWLWGYLSGYDQFRVTKNKHIWFSYDVGPVLDFVDRRCAEEPNSTPVIVLNRLMYHQEEGAAYRLKHPEFWPTER